VDEVTLCQIKAPVAVKTPMHNNSPQSQFLKNRLIQIIGRIPIPIVSNTIRVSVFTINSAGPVGLSLIPHC